MRPVIPMIVLWLCSLPTYAAIGIGQDDSILGNGQAAVDGFNLTIDTITGLEWLDVTLSIGLAYDEVQLEFGPNGLFEGFRYATAADIETFWDHSDVAIGPPHSVGDYEDDDIGPLVEKWGFRTNAARDIIRIDALFDDENPAEPEVGELLLIDDRVNPKDRAFLYFDQYPPDFADPNPGDFAIGSALVRHSDGVIPEPSSALIWIGVFVFGISYVFVRKKGDFNTSQGD